MTSATFIPGSTSGTSRRASADWRPEVSNRTYSGILPTLTVELSELVEPRTGYRLVTDEGNRSFADLLRRVQQHSQLDWGQIARALGVSRRTVHNWLSGTRVSGINAQRISAFYNALTRELANVERGDARAFLLAVPAEGESSPLARMTRYIRENYPEASPRVRAEVLLQSAATGDHASYSGGFDDSLELPELDENGLPVIT